MSDKVFKAPYATDTPKTQRNDKFYTPVITHSDSEESLVSTSSDPGSSDPNLSILAEYDEITRFFRTLKSQYVHMECSYIDFVENARILNQSFQKSREECLRLQERLDNMARDNSDLEGKLAIARKLLDQERRNTKLAERERDDLEIQMAQVKELLIRDKGVHGSIPEDTLSKFAFLETDRIDQEQAPYLSCIPEVNSTGSILSDFSYSKSEDDLDISKLQTGKAWKKHRPSAGGAPEQPAIKKRRSSGNKVVEISSNDTVRATTTLTLPKHGPITATSVIEAVPNAPSAPSAYNYAPSAPPADTPQSVNSGESYRQFHQEPTPLPPDMIFQSWARKEGPPKPIRSNSKFDKLDAKEMQKVRNNNNNNNGCGPRQHSFQKKACVLPEVCGFCQKRVRFGRMAWKCKDCKNMSHDECKDKLPLPCIPVIHTPNQRNGLGTVGDYTGLIPPMVPAIIIHCITEIEQREPKEIGLYRVSGSEKDVKSLKERFLKGKAAPPLNDVDIHVLCGVVKDFLRSLQERLISNELWNDLVTGAEINDSQLVYSKISELPQPNRDTLAYLMLHLQRISELREVKMPVDNLATVFGPTIIEYPPEDAYGNRDVMKETRQVIKIMRCLITLPKAYWETFVNVTQHCVSSRLQQTPSTDSLLVRPVKTPPRAQRNTPKRRRFFPTPPDNRY